jgi:hypothetical protein
MVQRVSLLTFDEKVVAPPDIIYSTSPRRAVGDDGRPYFIKGPDLEVVFAEITGCVLAREVGLPVPDVAACYGDGETYAGSAKVKDALRELPPFNYLHDVATNYGDLFDAIVVDVWLANTDRNFGNVVCEPQRGGRVKLVFIDFEKSVTLRPQPIMSSMSLEAWRLWPTGELGNELRARKPLRPPQAMIERIHSLSQERCNRLVTEAVDVIGSPVGWADDSVHALSRRAGRIAQLVEEVWAAV